MSAYKCQEGLPVTGSRAGATSEGLQTGVYRSRAILRSYTTIINQTTTLLSKKRAGRGEVVHGPIVALPELQD